MRGAHTPTLARRGANEQVSETAVTPRVKDTSREELRGECTQAAVREPSTREARRPISRLSLGDATLTGRITHPRPWRMRRGSDAAPPSIVVAPQNGADRYRAAAARDASHRRSTSCSSRAGRTRRCLRRCASTRPYGAPASAASLTKSAGVRSPRRCSRRIRASRFRKEAGDRTYYQGDIPLVM